MRAYRLVPIVIALASGVVGSIACSADVDDAGTGGSAVETGVPQNLDVNDIGGVLGLQNGAIVPRLPLRNTFLPDAIFKQITDFAQNTGSGESRRPLDMGQVLSLDNWFPTGWRFDPCAATVPDLVAHHAASTLNTLFDDSGKPIATAAAGKAELDKPTCTPQLRLVNQPVINGQTRDFAMHLVYDLDGPAERDAVIAELMQLKIDFAAKGVVTTNVPLGVHPALAANADAGVRTAFAQRLQKIITDHVGKNGRNLSAIAFMGLENAFAEPWVFFAGRVDQGKSWSPVRVPVFTTLSELGQPCDDAAHTCISTESFRQNGPVGVFAHLPPRTQDGMFLLTGGQRISINDTQNTGLQGLVSLTRNVESQLSGVKGPAFKPSQLARDGTFHRTAGFFDGQGDPAESNAVNNPRITNFFTTDCVSCHTSSQTLAARVPVKTNLFTTPPGVTGFVDVRSLQSSTWNVRNCGYFFNGPAVGLRTANEAAEGVAAINMYLLHQIKGADGNPRFPLQGEAHNPGDDCSKNTLNVLSCFLTGSFSAPSTCMGPAPDKCAKTDFAPPVPSTASPIAHPDGPVEQPKVCTDRAQPPAGVPTDPNNSPSSVQTNGSKTIVKLSVADAVCFSRLLTAAFVATTKESGKVSLQCGTDVTDCSATFDGGASATVQGADAAKLRGMFGASFQTTVNGPDGAGLTITCNQAAASGSGSCTLAPSAK